VVNVNARNARPEARVWTVSQSATFANAHVPKHATARSQWEHNDQRTIRCASGVTVHLMWYEYRECMWYDLCMWCYCQGVQGACVVPIGGACGAPVAQCSQRMLSVGQLLSAQTYASATHACIGTVAQCTAHACSGTVAQCTNVRKRTLQWNVLLELLEVAVDNLVARQQRQPVVKL
jgi:hypothetical protein